MNCPSCGYDNPDRAKFCLECGDRFAARCRSCGTDLPAGAKFCLECGTLARESGQRASAAQVEEARAELAAAAGDDAGRAAHLREAQRIYSELGATGHAERVASELATGS